MNSNKSNNKDGDSPKRFTERELRSRLNPIQFAVTQEKATEM